MVTTKDVHYRRFDSDAHPMWAGRTFFGLIRAALGSRAPSGDLFRERYVDRTFRFPKDPTYSWLAHNLQLTETSAFGTLCLFSPNEWAAVLRRANQSSEGAEETLTEAIAELEVAERPPIDGEDYLRGISYWLVIGNHLFVVQHVSLQTKAYEQYFQQLFHATGLNPGDESIALISEFDRSVIGGDLGDVLSVEIGGLAPKPLQPATLDPLDAPPPLAPVGRVIEAQTELGTRRISRFDKASEILQAIFGAVNADQIMNEVPPDAELEVDVRFGYRTRRRAVSRVALNSLAQAARNLPDGEVRAFGRDGKQIGNDLRLSTPMPFKPIREKSSLLDPENAREQLLKVYSRFVEDKKIEP